MYIGVAIRCYGVRSALLRHLLHYNVHPSNVFLLLLSRKAATCFRRVMGNERHLQQIVAEPITTMFESEVVTS